MARSKKPPPTDRAKPHARKKVAALDRAAMTLDEQWAAGIRSTLIGACHPWQRDAVEDVSRRVSILFGRGTGKTRLLIARAILKMTSIREARIAYVTLSRPWAKRITWKPLKRMLRELGIFDDFTFSEVELTCTCKRTGSTYTLFGADDSKEIDKLRGEGWNEVQVDECASIDIELLDELVTESAGPRMGERQGAIVLAGTPGKVLRGRFHDVTRPGVKNPDGTPKHRPYGERNHPDFAGWIGWSSHWCNAPMVVDLPNALELYPAICANWADALLEKKNEGWSDENPKWKREYLALWAADDTTNIYAYRALDDDGSLLNRWEPHGGKKLEGLLALDAALAALKQRRPDLAGAEWLFGYGLDLGSRDPFALNILAFCPTDPRRCYYHVFGFERRKMYARAIAELLAGEEYVEAILRREKLPKLGGLFGRTGWPAAIVADLAGLGEAIILELKKVYGITIKAAEKKDKPGAIEIVNGDFIDVRMFIIADSPLEKELVALQWKPDEYGHPKEDKAASNHGSDALTYIRTELATAFAGAPPRADADADADDPPPAPEPKKRSRAADADIAVRPAVGKRTTKKRAPRLRDDWSNEPQSSIKRDPAGTPTGEYDVLISERDFAHGWGNE